MSVFPSDDNLFNKLATGKHVDVHVNLKASAEDQFARGFLEGAGFTVVPRTRRSKGWAWRNDSGPFSPAISLLYGSAHPAHQITALTYDLHDSDDNTVSGQKCTPAVSEPTAVETLTWIVLSRSILPGVKDLHTQLGTLPLRHRLPRRGSGSPDGPGPPDRRRGTGHGR